MTILGNFKTYLASFKFDLFIRRVYFTENNSALSRILFKDSDLKKMARMDEFIKVLFET